MICRVVAQHFAIRVIRKLQHSFGPPKSRQSAWLGGVGPGRCSPLIGAAGSRLWAGGSKRREPKLNLGVIMQDVIRGIIENADSIEEIIQIATQLNLIAGSLFAYASSHSSSSQISAQPQVQAWLAGAVPPVDQRRRAKG